MIALFVGDKWGPDPDADFVGLFCCTESATRAVMDAPPREWFERAGDAQGCQYALVVDLERVHRTRRWEATYAEPDESVWSDESG